jgi:preprotein translocase subunit SecD
MRNPAPDAETLLERSMTTVARRIDKPLVFARTSAAGFTVDVPPAQAEALARIRNLITRPGTLELRIVASAGYDSDGVRFDLADERKRFASWLADGGRERVLADARALDAWNAEAKARHVRWVLRRFGPVPGAPQQWNSLLRSPPIAEATVPLFDDTTWNDGAVPPGAPAELVEAVLLNLHEEAFTEAEIDPNAATFEHTALGPTIRFRLRNERIAAYTDWTGRNIGETCATVVDGRLLSAPRFNSRIPGVGMVHGLGSDEDAEDFLTAMRAGALPIPPVLVREEQLPEKAERGHPTRR